MNDTIEKISDYELGSGDKLFFDCNALMYVFYTAGDYKSCIKESYVKLFQSSIKKGIDICIPSILLSEFVNSYIRAEYRRFLKHNDLKESDFPFKKSYRETDDYVECIDDISNIVNNQILKVCKKMDDYFSGIEVSDILANAKDFDFNDRYYVKLAEKDSLKIVTHDRDFHSSTNVTILTENRSLWNRDKNNKSSEKKTIEGSQLF